MDYRDQVFLTVAECLSFSKAAEVLFISQPAVSKHIHLLEEKLKITLFRRSGNKIELSQAGELTYAAMREIHRRYQNLEFELGLLNDVFHGKLRIGASTTISQYILPNLLAQFIAEYPEVQLDLKSGNSREMERKLLSGEVDLVLVENSSSQSNISYQAFLEDELVLLTSPNKCYGNKTQISLEELKYIPIILREEGSGTLEIIRNFLKEHDIELSQLNIILKLGSTEAIKNFLYSFDGVALISKRAVKHEIEQSLLKEIDLEYLGIKRSLRIGKRHGASFKLGELFAEFIIKSVRT